MTEDGDDLRRRAAALVLERAFMFVLGNKGANSGKDHVTCKKGENGDRRLKRN